MLKFDLNARYTNSNELKKYSSTVEVEVEVFTGQQHGVGVGELLIPNQKGGEVEANNVDFD